MTVRIADAKIAYRSGVFETNSSSMHSLIVMKEVQTPFPQVANWNKKPTGGGRYVIEVGENDFGRVPLYFLGHPIDKFIYLVADKYGLWCEDNDVARNEFISKMVSRLDGCDGIEYVAKGWKDEIHYGYVDHQSSGIVWSYLKKINQDPIDFIFDERKIIIIDGDEYGAWGDMKESGLVDTDNIEYDLLAKEEE